MDIKKNKSFDSEIGSLLPTEFCELDFIPMRVFIVKDVPAGTIRGNHAHHRTTQMLYCIKGKIEVILFDGKKEEKCMLSENESVFVDKLIWDSQKFMTKGSILMVLSSTIYDEADYIFDKNEFIKLVS